MKTIIVAAPSDLNSCNAVITAAVMAWPLAERLRRLALPLLRYDLADLACYQLLLAVEQQAIVGVAAWDNRTILASPRADGALVHGLYVLPAEQGQGVGRLLLADIAARARQLQRSGLLIKAERVAVGYFEHLGLEPLKIEQPADYPYRFWQPL
jgi:GNAT superfamily N-acetyltransferase